MYYYQNGSIIFDSDIVSGDIRYDDRATPPGIFTLYYKKSPDVLRGTKKADGTNAEVNTLTREMKWGSMWTITVNPKVEDTTGKVGITITFDDSTNDKPIDIEIPSDWL